MSNNILVSVENLGSKVKGKYLYENINFSLYKGEIVGLLGHNGAGKSTMLRNIANLEIPLEGEVYINGKLNHINTFRNDIILVPDKIELLSRLSIIDNYELIKGRYEVDERYFKKYLKSLKVDEKDILGSLSKGNQEIVQLIILLSLKTKIILLDEPFSAIDIFRRELILKMLIEVVADYERTILITTHLIAEIESVLDRVIYLNDGEIVFDKDMEEIQEEGNSLVDYLKEYFREGAYDEFI